MNKFLKHPPFSIATSALSILIFLLIAVPVNAQLIPDNISITIVDENNRPMGVSVRIKGTENTFYSNTDGKFILPGRFNNSTLIISGLSIATTERKLDHPPSKLLIMLHANVVQMDEITVGSTGYQSVKPNQVNGAVIVLDNKRLNQQTDPNILKRMENQVAGLSFNAGKTNRNPQNKTNITVRGLSTINGPLDPLIVLDGFIYEGNIENINPNDVESITVLKDASASSIWGARAGNGVIVISTKKGRFNQKLQVSGNATFRVDQRPDLFTIPQVSSAEYIDAEQFLFSKGFFNSRLNSASLPITPAVEVFLQKRRGLITSSDSANQIDALKGMDARNDYEKYVYTNAHTEAYSLNMQGGGTNENYAVAIGYDKAFSTLREEYRKINIRLDNTFRPIQQLAISLNVYYTNGERVTGTSGYGVLKPGGRQVPYYSLKNQDGSPAALAKDYRESFTDTAGGGKFLPWAYYPLTEYKNANTAITVKEFFSNVGLQYKIAPFLNIELKHQYQEQQTVNDHVANIESYEARNQINLFSELNRATGIINYHVPLGGIRSLGTSTLKTQTLRAQTNFSKGWGDHFVNALAGTETREAKETGDSYMAYGYNADPLSTTAVDFVNAAPMVTGGANNIAGAPFFSNTDYRFVSLFGNISYSYKNRYSLSGSLRRDGSNIFGASTNDRWKPLWSAGSGWRISEEPWYRLQSVPLLKLRVSYGASGNIDLRKSALPVARFFTSNSVPFPFGRVTSLNNPDLKWEQAEQFNIGIDFGTRHERVKGTVDLYRKTGKDLYGETPYDYTTWGGASQVIRNVANMRGKGIDVDVQVKVLDKKVQWISNILYSYSSNKTTKYYSDNANNVSSLLAGGKVIIPIIGMPLYGIAAYKWGGLDSMGNPQGFLNGEKSTDYNAISEEAFTKGLQGNLVYKGSGSPTSFGASINSFSWRGLTASINISYRLNYYFLKPALSYGSLINSGLVNAEYSKRWQKPGDERITNVPSFRYPNAFTRDNFYALSEVNILRADNVKLNYINLAYSVNKIKIQRLPCQTLSIYANIADIGYLWKANKQHINPDFPGAYKPVKTFTIGMRTEF